VSAADEPEVVIWDLEHDSARRLVHDSPVSAVAISPAGDRVVVGTRGGDVIGWPLSGDAERGRLLAHHAGPVRDIAFSPSGDRVAAASDDGTASVIDGDAPPIVLRGHDDLVRRIAFGPHGDTIATVGEDGSVRLWDPRTGEGRVLRGDGPVADVAFPAVDLIVAAGARGTLWSWRDDLPRDPDELRSAIATLLGDR